jgi:Spy/CpxP family protein refolding chaperone
MKLVISKIRKMKKSQLLIWALVLLVILNVATIGTILYHKYQSTPVSNNIAINTGVEVNMLNGQFFRQTLGFNDVQLDAFRDINQMFRPTARMLTYRIDSLKNEMFSALQKESPDTVRLNTMSTQIGELHGRLKYETYHFYLDLKKICTPAQSAELEKAFQPLFKTENITTPNQHRRRALNSN